MERAGLETGDFFGPHFPHQKNGLMINLIPQPTEEEDLMPELSGLAVQILPQGPKGAIEGC